jgi:hypothetical protein
VAKLRLIKGKIKNESQLISLLIEKVKTRGLELFWVALKTHAVEPAQAVPGMLKGLSASLQEELLGLRSQLKQAENQKQRNQVFLELLLNFGFIGAGLYAAKKTGKKIPPLNLFHKNIRRPSQFLLHPLVLLTGVKITACWTRLMLEELSTAPELTPSERELIHQCLKQCQKISTFFSGGFNFAKT